MTTATPSSLSRATLHACRLPRRHSLASGLGLWLVAAIACLAQPAQNARAAATYAWTPAGSAQHETLAQRFAPPAGFERVPAAPGSWGEWLRGLPMKPAGAPVLTYTGAPKWRQDVHAGVIDIDVGRRDLQQCADAIMRLRGEWLFSAGRSAEIGFSWDGRRHTYAKAGKAGYAGFRKYMDLVFAYAGTHSLERELKPVDVSNIAVGDVFIKGGFPGHAILVADLAENKATGERRFLLVQSYMPAQEMHVLKNPKSGDGTPWYSVDFGDQLVTPEWVFLRSALRRWP